MASPTVQPRELHNESQRSVPSDHSNMRPESVTSGRSARLPPHRNQHTFKADPKVSSVEAAQAMEYLETETGFASYEDYWWQHADSDLRWDQTVGDFTPRTGSQSHCAIIDLSQEEASPPKASLRCENLSAVQAFRNLRTPPNGVAVQIVFWSSDGAFTLNLDRDFVTVFGLGLKLDPLFFQAFAAKTSRDVRDESAVDEWSLPGYFFVGGTIVAIAPNCPLAKPGNPPVLLIAGLHRLDYCIPTDALHSPSREAPPVPHGRPWESQPNAGDPRLYAWLLMSSMKQHPDCTIGEEGLLFGCLLPLLQLDILRMRARCAHVRSTFQMEKILVFAPVQFEIESAWDRGYWTGHVTTFEDTADSTLYRNRVFLRSIIERFEGTTEPLVRFISSQLAPQLTTRPSYHRIVEDRGSLLKKALSLEAELRDYLQLQVGQLSLIESRKSIEVSNNQLQENKRGK